MRPSNFLRPIRVLSMSSFVYEFVYRFIFLLTFIILLVQRWNAILSICSLLNRHPHLTHTYPKRSDDVFRSANGIFSILNPIEFNHLLRLPHTSMCRSKQLCRFLYFFSQNGHVFIRELSSFLHLCLRKFVRQPNVFEHLSHWYFGGAAGSLFPPPPSLETIHLFRSAQILLCLSKHAGLMYFLLQNWHVLIPERPLHLWLRKLLS